MSTDTTAQARYRATGKRKSSIARVTITPGTGQMTVNGQDADAYFGRKALVTSARQPLVVAGFEGRYDVAARSHRRTASATETRRQWASASAGSIASIRSSAASAFRSRPCCISSLASASRIVASWGFWAARCCSALR